jgi:hypothetical protein
MGMNFPDAPTNGQVSGPYTWDGEKWVVTPGSAGLDQATGDARYVNVSGDTMVGGLDLAYVNPTINLKKSAAAQGSFIAGYTAAAARWLIQLGDATPESGSNAGSDFGIMRYNDAGASLGPALTIRRSDGFLAHTGALGIATNSSVTSGYGAGITTGTYWFGNSGTKSLSYDGTNFNLTGGSLVAASQVWGNGLVSTSSVTAGQGGAGTTGTYYFGNSGTKSLSYDGTNFNFAGGALNVAANIQGQYVTSVVTANTGSFTFGNTGTKYLQYDGTTFNLVGGSISVIAGNVLAAGHYVTGVSGFQMYLNGSDRVLQMNTGCHVRQSAGDTHMYFNSGAVDVIRFQTDGNILLLGTNKPYMAGGGPWLATSDARIKNVLGDYEHGLDEVLALQPVRYTYKGNDTDYGAAVKADDAVPYADSPHNKVATDSTEFIGLIAQAVETVLPEMVTQRNGMIDGQAVTDLRALDTGPLIFALLNAVKTLSARVEALEAA